MIYVWNLRLWRSMHLTVTREKKITWISSRKYACLPMVALLQKNQHQIRLWDTPRCPLGVSCTSCPLKNGSQPWLWNFIKPLVVWWERPPPEIPAMTKSRVNHSKKFRQVSTTYDCFKYSLFPRTIHFGTNSKHLLLKPLTWYSSSRGFPTSHSKQK